MRNAGRREVRKIDEMDIVALKARCAVVEGKAVDILLPADIVMAVIAEREMWKNRAEMAVDIGRALTGKPTKLFKIID
jgi:hypothetical protein